MFAENFSKNRVFADNLVGLGFLQPVSYIKPLPTHEKLFAVWEKLAQMPLLTQCFLGWVVALGWGVRRFHNNIYMFSNPTGFGISPNTLVVILPGIGQYNKRTYNDQCGVL